MHTSRDPVGGAWLSGKRSVLAALSLAARLGARAACGFSVAAATLLAAAPEALAARPAASGSIAVRVEGPDADEIRAQIVGLAPETVTVVSPDAFAAALKKAGVTKPVGDTLLYKQRRNKILDQLRAAAGEAKAGAVIYGISRTNKRKKKEVYLVYLDASGGGPIVDQAVPLSGASDELRRELEGLLGEKLASIAPAAAAEKKDEKKKDEKKKDESGEEKEGEPASDAAPAASESSGEGGEAGEAGEAAKEGEAAADEGAKSGRTPHDIGSAMFAIELGFELAGRYFDYSDPVSANLRPYEVFGAPVIAVAGEVYPLAATGVPVLEGLGLTAGYARAVGLDSAVEGGEKIGTTYERINGGLRERLTLAEGVVVGVNGGIQLLNFTFSDPPEDLAKALPDVTLTLFRAGVDGRVALGPVALMVGGDFLAPLSSKKVYERFKDPSVAGVHGLFGIMAPISDGFEARLVGEYTRFFSSFKPEVGDAYVAGGALDQLLAVRLSAAYIY